jgi:hypothetical protein
MAVVNQVDPGIDSFVLHLRVSWNLCAPLCRIIADEVVARSRQFILACNFGGRVGVTELHPQHATGRNDFRVRGES